MFRILLQTKAAQVNSPAVYQYLMDGREVWETDDKDEALKRYEAELDNYKRSIMTLIVTVDVDLNPTAECPCGEDYRVTTDTTYLLGKEYYKKNVDNTYTLLVVGVDYEVGDPIVGTVYEIENDDDNEY